MIGHAVALFAAFATTAATSGQLLLRCNGFNSELGGTIEHNIVISGGKATMDGDGETYVVESSSFFLNLSAGNKLVEINRTTGSYTIVHKPLVVGSSALDWSRPGDAGCVKAEQKF